MIVRGSAYIDERDILKRRLAAHRGGELGGIHGKRVGDGEDDMKATSGLRGGNQGGNGSGRIRNALRVIHPAGDRGMQIDRVFFGIEYEQHPGVVEAHGLRRRCGT